MARTPHKTYDIVHFIRCRIRYYYFIYDIVHLTYDVVNDIVCYVVYKNGKNLYHAHTISYILYDVVYDIVCPLDDIVYDINF